MSSVKSTQKVAETSISQTPIQTRSSATAEIARDADDVDFSVDDNSRSSVVVPIDTAYMTSY